MRKIAVVALLAAVVTLGGCRQKTVIPDSTLADIFHDAFVANAYVGVEHVNIDSLQIYEAIFERYGYTAEDVRYTVGNFSRRKSARLGSVVERAISRLEEESRIYQQRVVVLDTVRNVAVRTMRREVYADTLIEARKRADSTLLEIVIEPVYPGEYVISYNYDCEDDLKKYPRKDVYYFEGDYGGRRNYASSKLRAHENVRRVMKTDGNSCRLKIRLGEYEGKSRPKRQKLTINKLRVVYTPTDELAIDSLFSRYVDIRIFADEFFFPATDSLALSADSTRVATQPAH